MRGLNHSPPTREQRGQDRNLSDCVPTFESSEIIMRVVFFAVLIVLALTACAPFANSVRPGDSEGDVRARLGPPTATYESRMYGKSWEYNTGPYGRQTFMARFNREGKVYSFEQTLTETNFRKLPRGSTAAEVEERFGKPGYRYTVYLGDVWEYRIRDDHAEPVKMAVQFNHQGLVTEVAKVPESRSDSGIVGSIRFRR